jgi:hypothetical protein
MNFEKVVFGFFVVLAATLNFGFWTGGIDIAHHHNVIELYAAVVVNIVATVLKFGDRTQIGAVHLATSLCADIQLLGAAAYYIWASQQGPLSPSDVSVVVSLSGGALFANVVSVTLLMIETASFRRR